MTERAGKPSGGAQDLEIPDLDLPASQKSRSKQVAVKETAPSARDGAPRASSPSASSYAGDLDLDDDDMVVDRNVVPDPISVSITRKKPAGLQLSSGLELGTPLVEDERLSTRSHEKVQPKRALGATVVNGLVLASSAGIAGAALFRFVHRPAGYNVVSLLPAAFDGSSATWSAVTSLVALAVTITLTIMGMYARPRSLGYLLAALALLLVAIGTMVITFSVGPDGAPETPPDGALIVPWAIAFVPFGVALRLLRNAWERADEGDGMGRLLAFVMGAASSAMAFVGVELLLGAGLMRLF